MKHGALLSLKAQRICQAPPGFAIREVPDPSLEVGHRACTHPGTLCEYILGQSSLDSQTAQLLTGSFWAVLRWCGLPDGRGRALTVDEAAPFSRLVARPPGQLGSDANTCVPATHGVAGKGKWHRLVVRSRGDHSGFPSSQERRTLRPP